MLLAKLVSGKYLPTVFSTQVNQSSDFDQIVKHAAEFGAKTLYASLI
jgi:hypothetical protein